MTVEQAMILKYQLVLIVMSRLLVSGEWVEMPQFSDGSKVYKLSVRSHNNFYNKFSSSDHETQLNYDAETTSQLLNEFGNTDKNTSGQNSLHETKISVYSMESATINPLNLINESSKAQENNDYVDDDSVNIFSTDPDAKEILPGDVELSTPAILSTLELLVAESSATTTAMPILPAGTEAKKISLDGEGYNNQTVEGLGFQEYLPMEMLQKVHRTLKSQPSTLKGKIRFLKEFERNLIAEIEAQLNTALAPIRRTRGTHDYYDHDDEMGFPSLEGALMAISFLTFAVYLIRLVMLLFRNANNTSTTAATILFNRNRRSTDTLTNKTAEILNYLNTFESN